MNRQRPFSLGRGKASLCPIPDLETVVPTGHPDQTQSFNSPALDRALQPNNDPFGAPWSAAMDVGGWLRGLGLGQYEALFRASEIDADILPELTDADLEKLSVPLGHRKRLLRAISGLAAAETSAAPDGDVLRSGRLDGLVGAVRPRRSAQDYRRLPSLRHRDCRGLWRVCRPLHGRRRPGLFRLSAGA